jgi:enoyl-CoA hydratase/carnithine racemase
MAYEMRIEDNIVIFQFKSNKVSSIQLETLKALDQVIDRVNNEEDLKGIILVGTDRYFSGGFDLNEFVSFQGPQEIIDWFKIEEEVLYKLFICSKPVIAAVNGAATAAGMIVACAADYRIAMNHPKIKVGMTEIKLGLSLTPAEAGLMRWGLDTEKNYRDIIFKGDLIPITEAVERGRLRMRLYCPMRFNSSATCMASSRVGVITIAWIESSSGLHCSARGMPKAAVLPVPVWALPITSRPCITRGMVIA